MIFSLGALRGDASPDLSRLLPMQQPNPDTLPLSDLIWLYVILANGQQLPGLSFQMNCVSACVHSKYAVVVTHYFRVASTLTEKKCPIALIEA